MPAKSLASICGLPPPYRHRRKKYDVCYPNPTGNPRKYPRYHGRKTKRNRRAGHRSKKIESREKRMKPILLRHEGRFSPPPVIHEQRTHKLQLCKRSVRLPIQPSHFSMPLPPIRDKATEVDPFLIHTYMKVFHQHLGGSLICLLPKN